MRNYLFIGLIALLVNVFAVTPSIAGDVLRVTEVWSRATPPLAEVGAAYFIVENPNNSPDTLIEVASPVAERVEMHTHVMTDGMMMMRQLDSVEVPAGGNLEFKPGGNHVMLIGLERPLVAGERFPLTLRFKEAGDVELIVEVRGLGSE
jgi:periplasmic copper chaperone A